MLVRWAAARDAAAKDRHLIAENDWGIFADPATAGLWQRDAARQDIISALVVQTMKPANKGAH